jgi:hypothetical protein
MVKKELTIRERRKIYEDAIYVVAQTQKMSDKSQEAAKSRAMRGLIEKQLDRCSSIIYTVLGYHEVAQADDNGVKKAVLMHNTENSAPTIERKRFDGTIIPNLPKDKQLKETLWKALVKGDKAAKERLNAFVEQSAAE